VPPGSCAAVGNGGRPGLIGSVEWLKSAGLNCARRGVRCGPDGPDGPDGPEGGCRNAPPLSAVPGPANATALAASRPTPGCGGGGCAACGCCQPSTFKVPLPTPPGLATLPPGLVCPIPAAVASVDGVGGGAVVEGKRYPLPSCPGVFVPAPAASGPGSPPPAPRLEPGVPGGAGESTVRSCCSWASCCSCSCNCCCCCCWMLI